MPTNQVVGIFFLVCFCSGAHGRYRRRVISNTASRSTGAGPAALDRLPDNATAPSAAAPLSTASRISERSLSLSSPGTSGLIHMRPAKFVLLTASLMLALTPCSLAGQATFLERFQARVSASQAEQPHWVTSLVTVTPRLEQEIRAD